jgi:hypothetical protein
VDSTLEWGGNTDGSKLDSQTAESSTSVWFPGDDPASKKFGTLDEYSRLRRANAAGLRVKVTRTHPEALAVGQTNLVQPTDVEEADE